MSKIPYVFETPIPVYFRKNGWFKKPNVAVFISWCFSRCSCEKRRVFHDHKEIELEPFEFIFGRRICSEETGLTEREIRSVISWLCPEERPAKTEQNRKMLEKTTSKTTNKFTVYRWLTDVFLENSDQQNDQQTTSRRPADDHNLEDRSKNIELLKEKNKKEKILPISENEGESTEKDQPSSRDVTSDNMRLATLNPSLSTFNKKYKPKKSKQASEEKINFREWVELTQKEFDTLISSHGEALANSMLDALDAYNTTRQEHYKSDYGAMKKGGWVYEKALTQQNSKEKKPTSIREKVMQKFQNGKQYNGADCYVNGESIAFSRGITHYQLRFNEHGFWSQFENILLKMGIKT